MRKICSTLQFVMKCVVFIILLVVCFAPYAFAEPRWEPLPLTSPEQYKAGIKGGEGLQYVFSIVYAPSNPDRAYLSTDTSGVWRSDDGGTSWKPSMNNFLPFGARSLAVDPLNPDIVFAAGFMGNHYDVAVRYPTHEQGVYRSLDGGNTWEAVLDKKGFYKQDSKGDLFAFVQDSNDSKKTRRIYAATYEGLFYSEQGGDKKSWRGPVELPKTKDNRGKSIYPEILDIKYADSANPAEAKLFIATKAGLFVYQNGKITRTGKNLPDWPRSIAISRSCPGVITAALGLAGLYQSNDSGVTFKKLNAPELPYSDVAVSPVDCNIQYARADKSGKRPVFSKDGGKTWRYPSNSNKDNLIPNEGYYYSSPFALHPANPLVALHVSNGRARIIKTIDGGDNWRYSGSGFSGGRMADMIFTPNGEEYMCLTDHGLWQIFPGGVVERLEIDSPLGNNSMSACSADQDMFTVAIGDWGNKVIATGTPSLQKGAATKFSWYYDSTADNYRYSFTQKNPAPLRVAGKRISQGQYGRWKNLTTRQEHTVVAVFGGKKPVIYALKQSKNQKYAERIEVSVNMGKSWRTCAKMPSGISRKINNIAVYRDNSGKNEVFYVAAENGLWIYRNKLWEKPGDAEGFKRDPWGNIYVTYVTIDPIEPNIVYAARHGRGFGRTKGIYRSTDSGKTWHDFSFNFPTEAVHSIKVNPYTGDIYIGSSIGTYYMKRKKL